MGVERHHVRVDGLAVYLDCEGLAARHDVSRRHHAIRRDPKPLPPKSSSGDSPRIFTTLAVAVAMAGASVSCESGASTGMIG